MLKKGGSATAEELSQHCRGLIAGFKVPKEISSPKRCRSAPTGKVLKRVLRDALWQGQGRAVG